MKISATENTLPRPTMDQVAFWCDAVKSTPEDRLLLIALTISATIEDAIRLTGLSSGDFLSTLRMLFGSEPTGDHACEDENGGCWDEESWVTAEPVVKFLFGFLVVGEDGWCRNDEIQPWVKAAIEGFRSPPGRENYLLARKIELAAEVVNEALHDLVRKLDAGEAR